MSIEIRRGSGEKTPQFWSSEVSVMYGRTTLSDFRLISDVGRFQTTRLKTVKTRKTLIAIRPAVEDSRRCCTRLPYTFGPKGLQNRRGDLAAAPFCQVRGGLLGELALSAPYEEDAARKHGRGREERDPHRKAGERKVPAGRRSRRAAGRAAGGRAGDAARGGGPGRAAVGRAGRLTGGFPGRSAGRASGCAEHDLVVGNRLCRRERHGRSISAELDAEFGLATRLDGGAVKSGTAEIAGIDRDLVRPLRNRFDLE